MMKVKRFLTETSFLRYGLVNLGEEISQVMLFRNTIQKLARISLIHLSKQVSILRICVCRVNN